MSFDVDLFVIGAGSGGVRAARFAAGFGARVAVAESRYLGGTCVNVGCVPKKLLVYGASYQDSLAHAGDFGWQVGKSVFDWSTLIANKNTEISRLNGIYKNLLSNSGVTLYEGHARLLDAHTIEINGQKIRAAQVLIATGGWPSVPTFPGSELAITSNDAFFLEQLPKRMLVVGGGYIAVEFASIFQGLGAETSLLYRGDLFLRGFDQSVREHVRDQLAVSGLDLQFNTDISALAKTDDGRIKASLKDGRELIVDCVFYGTGRRPMLDNLGLENTDIQLTQQGYIAVDKHYVTSEPSISAIGDVIGDDFGDSADGDGPTSRLQLTPVALAEGMAVARRLFKPDDYRAVNYQLIPTAVFCLPNIGTVGISEEQALAAGHRVDIYESRFKPMKLSLSGSQERSLMKLVVDADTDIVLGCHVVGPDAGELVQGIAVAMKAGATKAIFDDTIGIHPTSAEELVTLRSVTRTVG
ncbi:MAG: glutathione-disulfide reductase [Paraperlucidibaca sp.]